MFDVIQYILVGLMVTAAVGYVSVRLWRLLLGKSRVRCSGCSSCNQSQTVTQLGLPDQTSTAPRDH